MKTDPRMWLTALVMTGAIVLAALGRIDQEALLALLAGGLLPSPVVRDISAE